MISMNKTITIPVPTVDDHRHSNTNNINNNTNNTIKSSTLLVKGSKSIRNKTNQSLPNIEGSLNLSIYSTSTLSPWIERVQSPKSKQNIKKSDKHYYNGNNSDVLSVATSISPSQSRVSSPSMKLKPIRVNVEKNFLTVTPKPLSPKSKERIRNITSSPSSSPDPNPNELFDDELKDFHNERSPIVNSSETISLPRTAIIDLTASLSFKDECTDIDRRGFRGSALSISKPIESYSKETPNFNPNESTGTLHTMYDEPEAINHFCSSSEGEKREEIKDTNSISSSSLDGSNYADSISIKSRRSDKDLASLTADTGIHRLTLHSRTLSQYTNERLSLNENIIPPYIITDIDKPPPDSNWYEAQTATYIVQNRLVGWKLTQKPRRREIINLFEMMEEVSPGTYTGGAQLSKLRKVAKSTLRNKFTSSNEVPIALEDFINSSGTMESTSSTAMELKRREADAWRKTVTRLIRARDSTPSGIAARLKNEKEEKEKQKTKGKGLEGIENERKSMAKLLCSSDRLDILESTRKQELMSRERERDTISRERVATPGMRLLTPSVLRASNSLYGGAFENDERMKDEDDGLELYIRDLYSRGTSRGGRRSRGSQGSEEFIDDI